MGQSTAQGKGKAFPFSYQSDACLLGAYALLGASKSLSKIEPVSCL